MSFQQIEKFLYDYADYFQEIDEKMFKWVSLYGRRRWFN